MPLTYAFDFGLQSPLARGAVPILKEDAAKAFCWCGLGGLSHNY